MSHLPISYHLDEVTTEASASVPSVSKDKGREGNKAHGTFATGLGLHEARGPGCPDIAAHWAY